MLRDWDEFDQQDLHEEVQEDARLYPGHYSDDFVGVAKKCRDIMKKYGPDILENPNELLRILKGENDET